MKSQAISVVATSSQSAKPHATSHWNGAPQQPNSNKVLHGYSVLLAEDSTYSETESESNTIFQHGVMADVRSRLLFASAASEEPANTIPSLNSVLRSEINERVSQPLRKSSEPQPRGCELPRSEFVHFTQDLSYSVEQTIPPSAPRCHRPEKDETTTNRPSRSEKRSGGFGPSAERVEDSPRLDRNGSAIRDPRSSPAWKAASLQLDSIFNRNSNDSMIYGSRNGVRLQKISNPSTNKRGIPVSATSTNSAKHAPMPPRSCAMPESNTSNDLRLQTEISEKSSKPQPQGCEIFQVETVNFTEDLNNSEPKAMSSSSLISPRSEKAVRLAKRPSRSEKPTDQFEIATKSYGDSTQFDRIGPSTRPSTSLPARNAVRIQLGSILERTGRDNERNVPINTIQKPEVSNPQARFRAEVAKTGSPFARSITQTASYSASSDSGLSATRTTMGKSFINLSICILHCEDSEGTRDGRDALARGRAHLATDGQVGATQTASGADAKDTAAKGEELLLRVKKLLPRVQKLWKEKELEGSTRTTVNELTSASSTCSSIALSQQPTASDVASEYAMDLKLLGQLRAAREKDIRAILMEQLVSEHEALLSRAFLRRGRRAPRAPQEFRARERLPRQRKAPARHARRDVQRRAAAPRRGRGRAALRFKGERREPRAPQDERVAVTTATQAGARATGAALRAAAHRRRRQEAAAAAAHLLANSCVKTIVRQGAGLQRTQQDEIRDVLEGVLKLRGVYLGPAPEDARDAQLERQLSAIREQLANSNRQVKSCVQKHMSSVSTLQITQQKRALEALQTVAAMFEKKQKQQRVLQQQPSSERVQKASLHEQTVCQLQHELNATLHKQKESGSNKSSAAMRSKSKCLQAF